MRLLTLGALRKETGISLQTLRRYADAGWIDCELDSTGRRIFTIEAIAQARQVFESRTSRRSLVA
jgi:DNA-binding transcriptional MerR regulator